MNPSSLKKLHNHMAFLVACEATIYFTSIVERAIVGWLHEDQLIATLFKRKT
jgi:hypothetical protein